MFNFSKIIFTWWNQKTVGTMIYTFFFGKLVGQDIYGNRYYQNLKLKKRWVIYKNEIEASKIPVDWYLWMHYTKNSIPLKNSHKYIWEKPHVENLTGTSKAYKPQGSLRNKQKDNNKKYETWKI